MSYTLNGGPKPPGRLRRFGAAVVVRNRGLTFRRQWVQADAEQRMHLLSGDRIAHGHAVDAAHPSTNPMAGGFALGRVVIGQRDLTFVGGIQRRHLPGQVVVPGPAVSLRRLIVTPR